MWKILVLFDSAKFLTALLLNARKLQKKFFPSLLLLQLQAMFIPPSNSDFLETSTTPGKELFSEEAYRQCISSKGENFKRWDFNEWEMSEEELVYLALYM